MTDQTHPYRLQDLNFARDDAGNVLSILDPTTLGGTTKADNQCFTYDAHRRLTEAWTPKSADCATSGRTTANLDGAAPRCGVSAPCTFGHRAGERHGHAAPELLLDCDGRPVTAKARQRVSGPRVIRLPALNPAWSRPLRLFAILLVLAGVLSGASNVFPKDSGPTELLRDAREGQVSSVHVVYLSPSEVQVRWTTGYLGEKAYLHRFSSLPDARSSSDAYVEILRQRLGAHAEALEIDMRDPLAGLGGVSLVVPLLYGRFIAVAWLKWATLTVFATCVVAMVGRKETRAASPGYWLSASLLLGSGVLAHLWSEPFSLRRPATQGGAGSTRMPGWGVLLRSVIWLAVTVVVVTAVLTLR